jgi:hypothetical protein
MFSSLNFFDYVIIISGVLLCFKRVAEMERWHTLRVLVLSSMLTCIVIVFFVAYGFTFGEPHYFDYDCPSREHFCVTE